MWKAALLSLALMAPAARAATQDNTQTKPTKPVHAATIHSENHPVSHDRKLHPASSTKHQGAHTAAKPAAPPPTAAAPASPPVAAAPAAPAKPPPDAAKGTVTGLPIPRFVSLRTDDVNLRSGPGTRYPIEWVYKRRDLPVEVEREFEVWRLVRDPDGVKGWVHQATLTGRRNFFVTGGEQVMRESASDAAVPVAKVEAGVVGRIRECPASSDWCEVQVGDVRGWLKREAFWGTLPGEAVGG